MFSKRFQILNEEPQIMNQCMDLGLRQLLPT
jgi:hypothetical protein